MHSCLIRALDRVYWIGCIQMEENLANKLNSKLHSQQISDLIINQVFLLLLLLLNNYPIKLV
ncbi:hypothetical protein BpHYR1_052359 [Brachionus plicatilis]|uniref:Uncharacterized protein n=1 Tax=Brachionus plicatilis TaxID=10195 RepID=A0A3M7T165_BRAPC|nr:hypothetical protein BpHYR1_052359 [Brachionus plicatilis]